MTARPAHMSTEREPLFSDDEARALRVIFGLAYGGRGAVSNESREFLDGHESKLPNRLKQYLSEAAGIIHGNDQHD